MKVGFWDAPEGAEQPVSVFPIGEESLNASKGGSLTAAGALAKLATLDSVELAERCPNAVALLAKIAQAIAGQKADGPTQLFRLANLNELESKLIADVLGEGEVAGVVALPDGSLAQIQESVLAGIWRVRLETDAASEYLEIGAIPEIVKRAAADLTSADFEIGPVPEGAMNVLPVLAEIRERALAWRPGMRSQIINFTLLPMSQVDMSFLQDTIGNGPIQLVSRGYGTCRVLSTGIRNVWSVQFFNAMDTIILDTLEVGGVPTVALAAEEDFEDSAERLQEIIEAYFK
jgi:hydrogenase-1 operon protein HyaF